MWRFLIIEDFFNDAIIFTPAVSVRNFILVCVYPFRMFLYIIAFNGRYPSGDNNKLIYLFIFSLARSCFILI